MLNWGPSHAQPPLSGQAWNQCTHKPPQGIIIGAFNHRTMDQPEPPLYASSWSVPGPLQGKSTW